VYCDFLYSKYTRALTCENFSQVADFSRVLQNPKQVLLGFVCQFTIMPLMGIAVATVFNLPVPLAVGNNKTNLESYSRSLVVVRSSL
jgi:hypothetical protein